MRNKLAKYIITAGLGLMLSALAAVAILMTAGSTPLPFDIVLDNMGETISLWENENGIVYAFLPGGCSASVHIKDGSQVTIDGKAMKDGALLSELSADEQHSLEWNGHKKKLVVMKGSGIASMMLSSAQGNIDKLYDEKNGREVVRTTLIDEAGTLQLTDAGSTIGTRGFSTRLPDKKPYNLKLSDSASLLGMPGAKKWTLLANAYDESGLKNKLVLDFAIAAGVKGTPQSRYVNLYLDGEYSGLYLLCERINNMNTLEDCEDQVLVTASFPERLDEGITFTTRQGRSFELKNDDAVDDARWQSACSLLQKTEDALSGGDPYRYIDTDSWCRHYLIEEAFGNSDIASLYFHLDTENEKIYAGPAWDYDNALGSSSLNKYVRTPTCFTANVSRYRDDVIGTYYSLIYNDESFYGRMKEIFASEYLPCMRELCSSGIDSYAELTASSAAMDAVRRKTMYEGYTVRCSREDIKDFIGQRADFLEDVWINGEKRCTITLKRPKNASYMYLTAKYGECIVLPTETELGVSDGTVWTNEKTGEVLSTTQPVTEDMTFTAAPAVKTSSLSADMKYALAATGLLVLLLGVMIVIDVLRRRRS